MKYKKFTRFIIIVAVFVSTAVGINAQTDESTQKLAARMVLSASLKPGDVVMIDGGKHMIPLMEAVAIEVQKAGGMPVMFLYTDRVTRSYYTDVPEKFLELEPRFWGEWYKNANVLISLPTSEDNAALFQGVSETKMAKINKAFDFLNAAVSSLPIRVVSADFPSKKDAELVGLDFPVYEKLMMDGIYADPALLTATGGNLRQLLTGAKQVRITTAAGTDFTFSLAPGREVYIDDAVVTQERAKSKLIAQRLAALPGGNVFFAPLETSANGKIVVPKARCRFAPMDNVSFEFKNGKLQNFKAAGNAECFEERMKANTGPKDMFGTIWIGTNPSLKVVEDDKANFRPFNAAGMVYIGVGENRIYGGSNNANFGYSFPITNATVSIDGKTVVKDGKLVL